jgi:quercetin dioxygenase-like cupin family protein
MRARRPPATIVSMIILYGAALHFESIDVPAGEPAVERRRPGHDTLLRVIDGTVRLEVDDSVRMLTVEDEARIAAGTPHRLQNEGAPARVLYELRSAVPSAGSNRRSPSRTRPSRTSSPGRTLAQPSTAATSR